MFDFLRVLHCHKNARILFYACYKKIQNKDILRNKHSNTLGWLNFFFSMCFTKKKTKCIACGSTCFFFLGQKDFKASSQEFGVQLGVCVIGASHCCGRHCFHSKNWFVSWKQRVLCIVHMSFSVFFFLQEYILNQLHSLRHVFLQLLRADN